MGQGQAGDRLTARLAGLRTALPGCLVHDRRRLAAVLDRLVQRGPRVDPRALDRLERQVAASVADCEARRRTVPAIAYDESLPVHARRRAIAAAIAEHSVIIVSGATGSGKSTQIPRICLEMGRGVAGLIGHTQPRRIAAQALAHRLSVELGSTPGDLVGYQVRFADRTGPRTLVKLMTDGLLLRELEGDPWLERYDTLIIDEAHERSLNVDFLLGVCKRLVARRPELRVVVTSATIETARFSEYFDGAPVVDVEGRSFPVEVRYRPLSEDDAEAPSLPEAIAAALAELGSDARGIAGDALVFLPGEKQIAEAREHLVRDGDCGWEVVALYARLGTADQERVFAPHARRRIVLATNVAETSLTIPGVRYVIDSGLARVSRYSPRAKIQRLPIEPVSRASAEQRKGRCGRVGEGICIRLYGEADYAARPEYTDPEILRTNLASLILRMAALGLGTPEDFPFLDRPDVRLLNDGRRLLLELGAVDGDLRITRLGRQMATLPVDPRIARVLVEAARLACLGEALVVAAFLSIQDPRERPSGSTQVADERHAQFADDRSDFVTALNLWRAAREAGAGGNRALRRWCRGNFLSYLRMREWQDLHDQLRELMAAQGHGVRGEPAPAARLHQAILAGFLGGIGVLEEGRVYLGARDVRFVIAPGTPLQKRSPRWVVAASLVETQRLYARMVAQVQPSWIESAGAHLVRRSYGDARWDELRGMSLARETVSLYGRVLSSGREVNFAAIDPAMARRMFVEEALVRRRSGLREPFLDRNASQQAGIAVLESKLRRRDLLATDDALAGFYLGRIPDDVATTRSFGHWWRAAERRHPHLLDMPREAMLARALPEFEPAAFPDALDVDGNALRLAYRFDPTDPGDGVTIDVPLPLLPFVSRSRLEWLVPGMLRDKVIALLRGLPKDLRRELVPIPDCADRFLESIRGTTAGSLHEALARFVTEAAGVSVSARELTAVSLAPWLNFSVRVLDATGRELRRGRDLVALQRASRSADPGPAPVESRGAWERDGVRRWDFGAIPDGTSVRSAGVMLTMYPAIDDAGEAVRLRLYPSRALARSRTRDGIIRLGILAMPQQHDLVRRACAADRDLALLAASGGMGRDLFEDIADRAVAEAMFGAGGPLPCDAAQFDACIASARARVADCGSAVAGVAKAVLQALREVRTSLALASAPAFTAQRESVRLQVEALLPDGWMRRTPEPWLRQLPKYLKAAGRRVARLRGDIERDRRLEGQLAPYLAALRDLKREPDGIGGSDEVERLRWMIEEFRVSLHAQDLRTLQPVSARRLDVQLARARATISAPPRTA